MVKQSLRYIASDGTDHATEDDARAAELVNYFNGLAKDPDAHYSASTAAVLSVIADNIVRDKSKIISILQGQLEV